MFRTTDQVDSTAATCTSDLTNGVMCERSISGESQLASMWNCWCMTNTLKDNIILLLEGFGR